MSSMPVEKRVVNPHAEDPGRENVFAAQGMHAAADVAPVADDDVPPAHGLHVAFECGSVADDHVPGGQTVASKRGEPEVERVGDSVAEGQTEIAESAAD